MSIVTFFAVVNVAEHSGSVESREGEAWPAPDGWTYQDVTGAHGTVLSEAEAPLPHGSVEACEDAADDSRVAIYDANAKCLDALNAWLANCPANNGDYCYTHGAANA